ncbi:MAG: hypothetical protein Q8S00_32475 [Deltaproteobacteria bacterium]|nr:hypothetical protein [Deltaproteobacteria bacterium]
MHQNPPWSNRALKQHWAEIRTVGLPMPVEDEKRWVFKEYGTGHFGVVMPTDTKGTVFKLTSDHTESDFIQLTEGLREEGRWPVGIVDYYAIIPLTFTFRRRQVFAIWREEAYEVGYLTHPGYLVDEWEQQCRNQFALRLSQFKDHAARFRITLNNSRQPGKIWAEAKDLDRWAWNKIGGEDAEGKSQHSYPNIITGQRGAYRLAASWRACEIIAELMENEHRSSEVGTAFSTFMSHGYLLADVHQGNIGMVPREDYQGKIWVITDPGHVVVLP